MIAVQSSLFILLSVYVYRSLSLLRFSSGRSILPRLHKTSFTTLYASDGVDHDDDAESLIEYGGLESSLENMETGVAIEELGLLVCVGPSLVADGRGLFVSILDEVESITLPGGTVICGYSKGHFRSVAASDKSVAFLFKNITGDVCLFEGQLRPLMEVINIVDDRLQSSSSSSSSPSSPPPSSLSSGKDQILPHSPSVDLTHVLRGHIIGFDSVAAKIVVEPDPEYLDRIFVPWEEDENENNNDKKTGPGVNINPWGPGRLGMYANDIAYYEGVTEELYQANSEELNTVQIVWRLSMVDKELIPTWPVVVTMRDMLLTNRVPTEVGLQYGWRYWQERERLANEQERNGEEEGK